MTTPDTFPYDETELPLPVVVKTPPFESAEAQERIAAGLLALVEETH